MSLFQSSEKSLAEVKDKILLWGPQHVGKTHTALTWPKVALVDRETRGGHFGDRVSFAHAMPTTMDELAAVFKEIKAGGIACESIVGDSVSAIYYDLVDLHTTKSSTGKWTTDWVTVNRRMIAVLNFTFGIVGKNVIWTAHSADKLIRNGNDFTKAGLHFVGVENFRFAFDYVYRLEATGPDPRTSPPKFHVEKSASPHLKVGQVVVGLDYAKHMQLTRGTAPKPALAAAPAQQRPSAPPAEAAPSPASAGTDFDARLDELLVNLADPDVRRLKQFAKFKRVQSVRLCAMIGSLTGDVTTPLLPDAVEQLMSLVDRENAA